MPSSIEIRAALRPELLAPAGGAEAMRAAVKNGADAIYFGLSKFSARARVENFSAESLSETMDFLRDHNVRGYIALNTLLFRDELSEAARYVEAAAEAGADAVIVQDLGVARLIRRMAPSLPIHASTQMALAETRDIFQARKLGISRVILARELPIERIRRVIAVGGLPVEVFVHGALCVARSGLCLASLAIGGRSANRGQCAQPCRLPYDLIVDGEPRDLAGRRRLLSPHDLCGVARIPDLLRAGVAAFKIEGRMKNAEYAAAVTRLYRRAIDDALAGAWRGPDPQAMALVEECFSRGTGPGYLDGIDRAGLVDGRTEGGRGVRLGVVTGTTRCGILLKADRADRLPRPGDGLVIVPPADEEAGQGGRVYAVRTASRTGEVEVEFGGGEVCLREVTPGAVARRTDDPTLRRRIESGVERRGAFHRTRLDVRVTGGAGGAVKVAATASDGGTAEVLWAGPAPRAITRPADEALLRDGLARLGDTPYELGVVSANLSDPFLLPKSVLNDLRRRLVESLRAQRQERARHAVAESGALARLRADARPAGRSNDAPRLYALVRQAEQLAAILDAEGRPDMVYCELDGASARRAALRAARGAGLRAAAVTPRVTPPDGDSTLAALLDGEPDALLVRSLGTMAVFRERAPELPLIADASLNAVNDLAVQALRELGAARVTVAFDATPSQTLDLAAAAGAQDLETVVHAHLPMMLMEHCPAATFLAGPGKPCGRLCRAHTLALRDRKGLDHPLRADADCRTTVFFGRPLSSNARPYRAAGIRHFRIEFLDESRDGVRALLRRVRAALSSV